jgi:antitoxin HicB
MRCDGQATEPECMPSYPVRIVPGEKGLVLVTFPDVPEAVACAASESAALDRAEEILDLVLAGYEAENRPFPVPLDICGAPLVAAGRYRIPV